MNIGLVAVICLSCVTVLPVAVFMVTKFAVAGYYSGKNYAHRRNY